MAKYTARLRGNFTKFLGRVEKGILEGSISATLEGGTDYKMSEVKCSIRVFERYSFSGGNRVSLSLMLFGSDDVFRLTAITSGGSTVKLFKINTIGEEAFLSELVDIVKEYEGSQKYEQQY